MTDFTICEDFPKNEVDEFYIGGQKAGKRGRGADVKTIFAVAVER